MTAPEPRWLTEPEQDAWYAWRRMFPLVNAAIARDLGQDSGLSEADYDVLSVLGSTDGHRMRISALAVLMQWSRSRLSHQITRMEQRGIVRREEVPGDGRGAEVVLTGAGVETVREAAPLHVESVRRHLIDVLTPEQLRTLAEVGEVLRERKGLTRKGQQPPPAPRR
ncbi:MarR family transcriptional regulator [Streptomyces sp. CB00455]|uniref:MarR family winged helix-turn-helix transcriptional regulator n=1 Tax=Streptomyces sp. CB00455 TaxID=1703927 RepID=UPI00093FD9EB|nr:MarR family transcriptional regulator [Streptomyces sp. CB00455]OKK19652.1 MarR family transcriptional regulator [Streptomyces sp. CB00455]